MKEANGKSSLIPIPEKKQHQALEQDTLGDITPIGNFFQGMNMKNLPFKKSKEATLGVELEYQIIDPITFDMISRAKGFIRNISTSKYSKQIKPEITQSMIEINSSVHSSAKTLRQELYKIQLFLLNEAKQIGVHICGGGTHPFQKWALRKIYPTKRFKHLAYQYRYLSKRSTVFGLHFHIGCANGDDALYLTHALSRFVPQFVAISASSPFYQSVDTGFHSTRMTAFNSFPMSGFIPYILTWKEFSEYFYKMRRLHIISTMKDCYWDIRPKPEFGTVEIRICDTPLTVEKAVMIGAYIQSLSYYLLREKPFDITKNIYYFYGYNRFQASRFGFEGHFCNPCTSKRCLISDDILKTINKIKKYAQKLDNEALISQLKEDVLNNINDATVLKEIYQHSGSLINVVQEQCSIWARGKY